MKTKKSIILLLALTTLMFLGCKQPNSNNGDGNGTPTNSIILHVNDNQLPPAATTTITITGNVTPLFIESSDPTIVDAALSEDKKIITATAGSITGVATITAFADGVKSNSVEITVFIGPDYQLEFIDTTATVKEKKIDTAELNVRIGSDIGTLTVSVDKPDVAEATIDQATKKVTVKGLTVGNAKITLTDGTNNSTNSATVTVIPAVLTLTLEQLKNPIGVGNKRTLDIARGGDLTGTGGITVSSSNSSVQAEIKGETVIVAGMSENTPTDATITITHTATGATGSATVEVDDAYTFVFTASDPSNQSTITENGTVVVAATGAQLTMKLTKGGKIVAGTNPNFFTMVPSDSTLITGDTGWAGNDAAGYTAFLNISSTAASKTYTVHALDKNDAESNEITITVK